jgi:membrane protein implicated in regulation of membrane protease activity
MSREPDELEDGGAAFGRFSEEEFDGIREGNGKIPWWLVLIVAVTVLEAFLWTMPWPGFGQRYDTVTTTFVSATGAQPFWDWGYYMILFQIIVVLSGIALIVWIINFSKRREREDAERREREGP